MSTQILTGNLAQRAAEKIVTTSKREHPDWYKAARDESSLTISHPYFTMSTDRYDVAHLLSDLRVAYNITWNTEVYMFLAKILSERPL